MNARLRWMRWIIPIVCALSTLTGCALLTPLPEPTTLEERLASMPTTDRPAPGSFEALQKTAHPFTIDRHTSDFGSQSRHLSDLADPDANHFVLLGGNDGWIGSPNIDDQIGLWDRGESIRMPLNQAVVEREFPIEQILSGPEP